MSTESNPEKFESKGLKQEAEHMDSKWLEPKDEHIVYEALSAIADGRFELTGESSAKCTSTSRGKFYTVNYDPDTNQIMSDDNMAYYRGEVSYPMVAMLLAIDAFEYDHTILDALKGIAWKDINQRNKNDYMKSVGEVLRDLEEKGVKIEIIENEVKRIFTWITGLELKYLGNKVVPPKAY